MNHKLIQRPTESFLYSLIFHGIDGQEDSIMAAFLAAFGERGCSFSLARDIQKHTPCELMANLTAEDADSKAFVLREAGVMIEIVPTADVADVKHRASECWAMHRASNGDSFTERDGVVVRGVSLDLDEQLEQWRSRSPDAEPWRFEFGYNHEHPTNTLDRHGLRMARERGAEIGAALTECFPDRLFLIIYRDAEISFCQFDEVFNLGISSSNHRVFYQRMRKGEGVVNFSCEVCERNTLYVIRSQSDAEFPHAQFVDCAECNNEMVLWADQEVVLASDAARWRLSNSNIPVDGWAIDSPEGHIPSSFEELKPAVLDRLHPTQPWREAAVRLWLGRELDAMEMDRPILAVTLLQIEELSALLLAYRIRQLSLPPENQDRTMLTPQRLGIAPSSLLYHPVRRVLAPVTVVTGVEEATTTHALLNSTDTRYTAGVRIDPERPIYECRFEYGTLDTLGRTFWRMGQDGQRYRLGNDIALHSAKPWTYQPYGVGKSLETIRELGTERVIAFTLLYDEQKRVIAQHRRLLRRFHELDLEPNPVIDLDLRHGVLTLRSDVFVWGIFLGWRDSKFPDNVFDLLPGVPYSISWNEALYGTPAIRLTGNSLFR